MFGALEKRRLPRDRGGDVMGGRSPAFAMGRAPAREPPSRPPSSYPAVHAWLEERGGRLVTTQTGNHAVLVSVGLWGRSASVLAFSMELEGAFLEAVRRLYELL